MQHFFSTKQLTRILIIVSIFTVGLIGINTLGELSTTFFSTLGSALLSVIIPFSIAFLLSFILTPLAEWIEEKTPLNKVLSVIAAITIGVLFVLGILSITLVFIISQMTNVLIKLLDMVDHGTLEMMIENMIVFLEDTLQFESVETLLENLEAYGLSFAVLSDFFRAFVSTLYAFTASVIRIGFIIVLTPVFLYYLIKDKTQVFNGIMYLVPNRLSKHLKTLGPESHGVIRSYFIGHGMVMIFITLFFMVTYSILSFFVPGFNIGHALLFALVMGLFSIIPYLGVWLSMSMPIVMFLTLHFDADDPGMIYIVAIVMIFVLNIIEEILESTLVQPNVFSRQVKIHPVAVLSSFIFFGALFGLVGFILAVPIAGTIKVSIRYVRHLNQDNPSPAKSD